VLPPFLRFVLGVIVCADIPLSISREHMQDSALISRIKTVMTARIIRWLAEEAKKDDGRAQDSHPHHSNVTSLSSVTPGATAAVEIPHFPMSVACVQTIHHSLCRHFRPFTLYRVCHFSNA
jgi:hypothetical protein